LGRKKNGPGHGERTGQGTPPALKVRGPPTWEIKRQTDVRTGGKGEGKRGRKALKPEKPDKRGLGGGGKKIPAGKIYEKST